MTKPLKLPKWSRPKDLYEGDSLVLDIILFLEKTEEGSYLREKAFYKAFEIASFCPNGISKKQCNDIMSVIRAYGSQAIKPILYLIGDVPMPEVIELAAQYVSNYNIPKSPAGEALLFHLKEYYLNRVDEIRDQCFKQHRSIVLWYDHVLIYLHTPFSWTPLNNTDK